MRDKSALNLWLSLQCRMIVNASYGLLIQHEDGSSDQVMAKWPRQAVITPELASAATKVIEKKRMQIAKTEQQQMILAQPVLIDGAFWGVVALHLRSTSKTDIQAALKLLQWGLTWLQLLLYQQKNSQESESIHLLSSTLKQRSLQESAIAVVNKLASYLKCERISLGLQCEHGMELQAVSFSANFDKRTRHMQSIIDAMEEAVEQRTDIHYPTAMKEKAALIVRSHENLRQINHSQTVHTLLMRKDKQILGAITIESSPQQPLPPASTQFLQQTLQILAQVFYIKQQAAAGTWQHLKKKTLTILHQWFGYDHLFGKLITVFTTMFILLMLIPGDYWVYGEATLESTLTRVLVAPQDGYLLSLKARPGALVGKNEILAQLDDSNLRLERRKLAGQLQQFRLEYDKALATYNRAQASILAAQVDQAKSQLNLIEQQLQRTQLTSPIDGIIVSDDISQTLGAPVQQGQILFEVASLDGYRVRLYVDERDIAALQTQQQGRLILTGLPGENFDFEVDSITPLSEVRDGRNYFKVEGQLKGDYDILRPGMTGSGRVLADTHPIGWIWFHDIWDWLRLTLWL